MRPVINMNPMWPSMIGIGRLIWKESGPTANFEGKRRQTAALSRTVSRYGPRGFREIQHFLTGRRRPTGPSAHRADEL